MHRWLFGEARLGWPVLTGWGLVWEILLGGALNLTGAISRPSVLGLILSGAALLFIELGRSRRALLAWLAVAVGRIREASLLSKLSLLVFLGLLLLFYASSVFTLHFNPCDDYQAYMVFPEKMIQTGSMGADPFSERRLLSLGGMSFL